MGRTVGGARWASFGAAIALVVGAGGVLTSSAADTATASSFVPITPCRLADTRPAPDNVGTRIAPIAAGESFVAQVTGTNGNCTIPTTATGVSMNITAIAPTAASFLTVWPTDQTRPLTANLNWSKGQAPTPNAVTATLSAAGSISLYNLAGTVEVTIDIVGYYQPSASGPAGPQGPAGPTGPQGPPGDPPNIITVAKSGGDFTSVAAAIAAATPTSASNRFLIQVGPGTYTEPGGVTLKDYVDIEGAGEDLTVITCACASNTGPATVGTSATMRISGAGRPSEIRHLTVTNTGGAGTYAVGIWTSDPTPGEVSLLHVTATASGAPANYGIYNLNSSPTMTDVVATAAATGSNYSVALSNRGSSPTMTDVTVTATGGDIPYGIQSTGGAPVMRHVSVTVSGGTGGIGFVNFESSPTLDDVRAAVSSGTDVIGVYAEGSTIVLRGATITVTNGASSYGLVADSSSSVTVRDSSITGSASALYSAASTVRVLSSVLGGGVVGSGFTCALTVDASYAALNGSCA